MNGVTQDLISQIAVALNATESPLVKDGIAYRILVFKEKTEENWVLALLPEIVMVEELFMVVNESFSLFKEGAITPNGIIFLCSDQSELLVGLAKEWYFEENADSVACL